MFLTFAPPTAFRTSLFARFRPAADCRRSPRHAVRASACESPTDHFREECGVVGVWRHPEASAVAYYALHALQHRGQEGAGIVSATDDTLHEHKGLGLVSEVFENALHLIPGDAAIAHNRYSTAGEKNVRNVQPFRASFREGQVAIAHNGNLTNAQKLRMELELRGSIFATSSDTEVVLHLMATSVSSSAGIERKAADALNRVEGAFSIILLTTNRLIAVRDPYGFRPLVMGELALEGRPPALVFASESCALDIVSARMTREIEPGEMVVVDRDGHVSNWFPFPSVRRRACVFEHIYFSKPSSIVFGRSVYMSRFRFGQLLATSCPLPEADAVVPVPESGVPAALGYASASGIQFQQAIIRSHYVGRTFIQPTQTARDIGVKLKLAPVEALIRGKSVVVVDDSIVRGTTSRKIVRMLREAGARQVHIRIACPPITGGCFYGVDTPDKEKLLSYRMSDEEACRFIEADSLAFLPLNAMHEFLGDEAPTFCDACFSGEYPVLPAVVDEKIGGLV
ncbi:Amidophosphoribosyltransferase 1, chloroplastic [Gracilariopsis chorda]|uniref:Amidophosphoribosyltransferase n=1 Tax=Gracilariopsis chorda TaxID=448386 RepID=A0A2V3IS01_9FLOR|nr:Amidophosphoribosyltransferase 1, chloroplastic [Gracilariopsis chorda]|eukprot:PXF44507.1 Amidophosphoribosyltransferase 1, chloroplastic [Gracilariopsis chorda]